MTTTAAAAPALPAEAPTVPPQPAALLPAAPQPAAAADRITPWRAHRLSRLPPEAFQRRRHSLGWLSFLIIVVLPVGLAAVYYFAIAADQYVAEFRFGLRSAEPVRPEPGTLFQTGLSPTQIGLDSYVVAQYIASRAAVEDLGKTLDLRKMFSSDKADRLARLDSTVPIEELAAYWRRQVDAFFDPTNGTIVVRARAFSPQDALLLARGILTASERLVNGLSARARRDTVRDSEKEVGKAESRLTTALSKLRDFRDREGLIDPHRAANSDESLDARVRDELVRADTELSILKEYMQSDAAPLKLLEARIQSLQAQRRAVASELTDSRKASAQALSREMGAYEELEGERRFAENAYQHALEALDRARIAADRQEMYIADFVPPRLPEEPLYPRRLRSLATVFLIAFGLWAIGGLILKSVRDHL